MTAGQRGSVSIATLGCTRNEVDSEELAGRLAREGWTLVPAGEAADVAVINTCGFIEAAKRDSIEQLMEAAEQRDGGQAGAVVAIGCLAQRYGRELAAELPEADAVLGFDSYADLSEHLRTILDGGTVPSHTPVDRRTLLPLAPVERPGAAAAIALPGHDTTTGASAGAVLRELLEDRPWAPLKIASGCDRRCAFCAIPSFRGAFVSRRPDDIVAEAAWLAERGIREVLLVSENSTSYGKDLGQPNLLPELLRALDRLPLTWVRPSYLQPAEIRPGLLETMAELASVPPWYDVSFQHASGPLLARMRRFGGTSDFLALIERIRGLDPSAAIRTNVIVGFPGETEEDVAELTDFLSEARLDAVGVFGYSDEEGTTAADLDAKCSDGEIAARVEAVTSLADEVSAQRAQDRIGERVRVLIEAVDDDGIEGRSAHQGPDVDGTTTLEVAPGGAVGLAVGDVVDALVTKAHGVDLVAHLEGGDPR